MLEILKNVAAIAGMVATILGLLATVSSGFREWFKRKITSETANLAEENKAQDEKLTKLLTQIEEVNSKVSTLSETVETLDKKFHVHDSFETLECRIQLERIYNEGVKQGKLTFFKRQAADNIYEYYTNVLHENSWGKLVYEQLIQLPVDRWDGTNPKN